MYMTWARLEEDKSKQGGDNNLPIITSQGRDSSSTLVYLGHNPQRGDNNIYRQMNAVNLDTATPSSDGILVAHHTRGSVSVVYQSASAADGEDNFYSDRNSTLGSETDSDRSSNMSADADSGRDSSTESTIAQSQHQIARCQQAAQLTMNQNLDPSVLYRQLYLQAALLPSSKAESDSLPEIPQAQLKQFKQQFIILLGQERGNLADGRCIKLAQYLLTVKNNPLAKERDYVAQGTSCFFWRRSDEYSSQTRSMHQAVGMLLQGVKDESVIKKSLFNGATVTLPAITTDASPLRVNFTRHRL